MTAKTSGTAGPVQLADAEARLAGIFSAAVDALVIIDDRGRIETFSNSAEIMFGYRAAETIGENVNILMPEPYHSEHDQYLARYVGGGEPRIIGIGREVIAVRKAGTQFPVHLSVGEIGGLERTNFIAIIHDISERKAIEADLKESEQELNLVIEQAPIGIFVAGANGAISRVNHAFCQLLGAGRGELLDSNYLDSVHDDDKDLVTETFTQSSQLQHALRVEHRLLTTTGTAVHVVVRLGVLSDSPFRLIGQIVDLTERIAAEAAAREQRETLAHMGRLTTLGEMTSGIAHEINQPLTAIANYAKASQRLLQRGGSSTDEVLNALSQISAQAERAGEIIRTLRDLAYHRMPKTEPVNLNQQIELVLELAGIDAHDHGAQIHDARSNELLTVLGDAVQIQQVTLNLIHNALDAMADVPSEDRVVTVNAMQKAGAIEVSVADVGAGVDADITARLFTPFFTTKENGLGLGLSLSAKIVEALGGRIWYTPNQPCGAIFSFSLPAAEI